MAAIYEKGLSIIIIGLLKFEGVWSHGIDLYSVMYMFIHLGEMANLEFFAWLDPIQGSL